MSTKHIYDHVERLGEVLRADTRRVGGKYGLLPVQLTVLHYLSICNRYSDTVMALSEYLGQTKGTVSQTLKVLEKKALIQKQSDTDDKRVTHLKVSAKGRRLLSKTLPSAIFVNACATLSNAAEAEILTALRQLLLALLQANNMQTFGVCKSCRYNSKSADKSFFCTLLDVPLSAADTELICREHANPA